MSYLTKEQKSTLKALRKDKRFKTIETRSLKCARMLLGKKKKQLKELAEYNPTIEILQQVEWEMRELLSLGIFTIGGKAENYTYYDIRIKYKE